MKKVYKVAVLPGDGVGKEVVDQAVKVLKAIGKKFSFEFSFQEGLIGALAIEKTGDPLPKKTLDLCQNSQAILFGAVGDPKYDQDPNTKVRPEQGLLRLRKSLGLYANLRPIKIFSPLVDFSPLKKEIVEGVDFIVVRELTGGIYFGEKGRKKDSAFDTCSYSREEIERIAKLAFNLALKRRRKLTLVDKANVLETSRLWRRIVGEMAKNYSKVEVEFLYVDNAAMQIVKNPERFDVILTENMFGDILTDEAAVITGSIGLLPSASLGKKIALYEPIHGSYPKAAGKNMANPIGAILSAGLMLEYSFGLKKGNQMVFNAVENVLEEGFGTQDIIKNKPLSTTELGEKIVKALEKISSS